MSIEVRQMVVKSSVLQRQGRGGESVVAAGDARMQERTKNEILAECRRLIAELLQERKER